MGSIQGLVMLIIIWELRMIVQPGVGRGYIYLWLQILVTLKLSTQLLLGKLKRSSTTQMIWTERKTWVC